MGAFWDAWDKYDAQKSALEMQGIQKATGLAGILAQGQKMQQAQKLQGLMSDPNLTDPQRRAAVRGLMTDPAQINQAYHLEETEKIARDKLAPKNQDFTSPIGKLLLDKRTALARGDTQSAALIDSAITKHNQTENSTSQENIGFLLDVKRKGAAATPEEMDKARFIFQSLIQPKVDALGRVVRAEWDDSFNPWKNFGQQGATTAPRSAGAPIPPLQAPQGSMSSVNPSMRPPSAFQIPPAVQASRDGDRLRLLEEELSKAPNDPALLAEVAAARSGRNYAGAGAGAAPVAGVGMAAPPVADGSRRVTFEGGKKYVREMPDGKGGMVGLTQDGKYEQIPMPAGARTDLQRGQVWNEERGAPEWLPNTSQYAKQSNDHAKDKGAIASTAQAVDIATKKIDELLDPENKDAFNSLFGGYNALATQFLPGKTQDLRAAVDSLKDNLKSAGKELLVNAGGTSIGQITEREWPILQNQIDKLTPLLSESQAAKVLGEIKTQMIGMKRRVADKYAEEWGDSQFANRKPRTGGATDGWDDKMRPPKRPKDVLSEADRILKGQ